MTGSKTGSQAVKLLPTDGTLLTQWCLCLDFMFGVEDGFRGILLLFFGGSSWDSEEDLVG